MSSSPDITLYMLPGTSAIFPHILLNQANLSFKCEGVPLERLYSDSTSWNQKQQVPVLVVNGEVITENPAIAHAINQLAPEAKLFGETPLHFVRVCEWMNYISAVVHAQAWGPYIRPFRFTTDASAEASIREASRRKLQDRFALIETKIPDQGWLLGTKEMTAADAYLLPFFQFSSAPEKLGDLSQVYPKWTRLMREVESVPAVEKTVREIDAVRRRGISV